jgi:peptidoglycan-associated lipoprotein
MKRVLQIIMISFIAMSFVVGCQKKVTKVEAPPPPPPPPAVEAPRPIPTPPPVEEFKPIDIGPELQKVLQTIYFDFDKYDLRPDAIGKLGPVAKFLQDHPQVRVLAEGNCDERGSSEYNMGLGENRAKAVKKYLVSYGIAADKIETTSYGKERPARLNCGADETCNEANRRVEWKVLAK